MVSFKREKFSTGSKILIKSREGEFSGKVIHTRTEPFFRVVILSSDDERLDFFERDIIDKTPMKSNIDFDDDDDDGGCWKVIKKSSSSVDSSDLSFLDVDRNKMSNNSAVQRNVEKKPLMEKKEVIIRENTRRSSEIKSDFNIPSIFISNLDTAISILNVFYENCEKIGVRVYSTHPSGAFLPPSELSMIVLKIDKILYLFDFLEIRRESNSAERTFIEHLRKFFESERILKIVHGIAFASSYLYRLYGINMLNIVDLDAAYQSLEYDPEKGYSSASTCLSDLIRCYIEDSDEMTHLKRYLSAVERLDWSEPVGKQHMDAMKIETAYLFDLYDTYLKKSIDLLKLNSMQLARVVKECSDDKLDVFFKNPRRNFLREDVVDDMLPLTKSKSKMSRSSTHSHIVDANNNNNDRIRYNSHPGEKNPNIKSKISSQSSHMLSSLLNDSSSGEVRRSNSMINDGDVNGKNGRTRTRMTLNEFLSSSNNTTSSSEAQQPLSSSTWNPIENFSCALKRELSSLSSVASYPHYNFKPAGYQPPNIPKKYKY